MKIKIPKKLCERCGKNCGLGYGVFNKIVLCLPCTGAFIEFWKGKVNYEI